MKSFVIHEIYEIDVPNLKTYVNRWLNLCIKYYNQ